MAYQLKIHAVTPRGEFFGFFGDRDESKDEVQRLADAMQESSNQLTRLVIKTPDGFEVLLNGQILKESVLLFRPEQVD